MVEQKPTDYIKVQSKEVFFAKVPGKFVDWKKVKVTTPDMT